MKIGVVGAGLVGSTVAYAMVMRGVGRSIVLVDLDKSRAQAEADDIYNAVPFAHQLTVRAGGYADLAGCNLVVIAAGVNQQPGETRLQLLSRNADVFRQVVPSILEHAPDAMLVVATNPVDVMTHLAAHFAQEHGLSPGRVIGSGTTLDTARFRALLASHVGIDPQHVHAYVLGEHGDSEVLAWSLVSVAGLPLVTYCRDVEVDLGDSDRQRIEDGVRRAAYQIIQGKGATYYGIGSAIARIAEVILRDQRAVLTVCSPQADLLGVKDVTVSMPTLIGGPGVLDVLSQPLNSAEAVKLAASAHVVKEAIEALS